MTANQIEKRAQVGRKLEGLLIDEDLFDTKPRGTPDGIDAPPRRKYFQFLIFEFII
jgi:hypothetical protein